jgi:VWFA-related protein
MNVAPVRSALMATGLVTAVVSASAQAPLPSARTSVPTFSAGVDVVRLDVFASRDGRPLTGLTAADFEVLDNGVPQRFEVESAGGPVHAVLLLDTSGSVAGERLDHLRAAAHAFVDGLGPQDPATLLTFSHDVRVASPTSLDRAAVHRALDEVQAGGGTALHDALFSALQFAEPSHGRGIVLVFSDGDDRLSWLDGARLRDAARRGEASVYAVALAEAPAAQGHDSVAYLPDVSRRPPAGSGPPVRTLPANVFRPSSSSAPPGGLPPLLRDIASDTGGEIWRAEGGAQLRTAFLQALSQVKSRYLLSFEPSAPTAGWHTIAVKLKGRKGEVRVRKGYLAGGVSSAPPGSR